jgi:Uma2 family endonuclease
MVASVAPTSPATPTGDERVLISGVSWEQYVTLRTALDDRASVRMTYLRGELEIMVTSAKHERIKTMIGRLLEIYALERGVELNGYGETTFQNRAVERGLEADECYVVGKELGEVPELAIEVSLTSGYVDKLAVYAGLGVPEVWFWRDERIEVWRLVGDRFERREGSELLAGVPLELLASFVAWTNQTAAVRAFRDALALT